MPSLHELPAGDEFHGVNFSQAETVVDKKTGTSTTRVGEMKVGAYTMLSWWKGILENQDTIDVSDDSERATLSFGIDLELGGETTRAAVYLEVFESFEEDCPVIVMYCYPDAMASLDPDQMKTVTTCLGLVNQQSLAFGNLEAVWNQDGGGRVRYRASLCLQGIAVGKPQALDHFVGLALRQLRSAFQELFTMVTG